MAEAEKDAFGVPRMPFSRQLARMSAELAANIYDLTLQRWVQAGFEDCTFLLENKLVVLGKDSDSRLYAIEAEWKRRRARSRMRSGFILADLLRGVRQMFITDMSKSVVMTRLLPDSRAVVAVSFIGTTQRFFDWITNFKFQSTEGMHHGFLALARFFEGQAKRIRLPKLAEALGRADLTLFDCIEEAGREDGGILFWLSGHSQGGALVQTFAKLLIERGVPEERIIGYTFAAPTVAVVGCVKHPETYPIYNIINTDDIVPRVGAQVRLGVDCLYEPDDAFRSAMYRVAPEARAPSERMAYIMRQIVSTEDAICFGIALMQLLERAQPGEELRLFFSQLFPFLAVTRRVGFGPKEISASLGGKLLDHHVGLAGKLPDARLTERYAQMMRQAIDAFGAKAAAQALMASLAAPHRIRPDEHDDAYIPSYIAIARRHLDDLTQGVWSDGARCVSSEGETLLPPERLIDAFAPAKISSDIAAI